MRHLYKRNVYWLPSVIRSAYNYSYNSVSYNQECNALFMHELAPKALITNIKAGAVATTVRNGITFVDGRNDVVYESLTSSNITINHRKYATTGGKPLLTEVANNLLGNMVPGTDQSEYWTYNLAGGDFFVRKDFTESPFARLLLV